MKQSLNNLWALIFTLTIFLFWQTVHLKAQTNFDKYPNNPILPLGDPGEWDDTEAAYAHVLHDGSMYHMWYSGAPQLQLYRIGYTISSDGINWTKDTLNNPVLGPGSSGNFDDAGAWLPWVLQDVDTFKMWYTGNISSGGIGYITTTDPTSWTRQRTNPVLTGDPGEWDNRVFGPVVLHRDSLYQMWYVGERNSLWQTGYATSGDGVNWVKDSTNNPVLPVGDPGEWDAVAAMAGSVLFADGQYHMWYHGTSGDPFTGGKIGYATSPDGITWDKHPNNPILVGDSGAWDAVNTWFPMVIKDGDWYRMWYTGRGASDIDRLGYAVDSTVTGIKTIEPIRPEDFHLKQNYPNPFNPATTIEFSLSQSGFVSLKVYNILGEEVAALLQEHKPAGQYAINFDASQLTSGIYYYTLTADDFKQSRKMVLLR